MNPSTITELAGLGTGNAPAPNQPVPASGPRSLGQMVLDAADRYDGIALSFTRDGRPASLTYKELGVAVREIARGLIALGIGRGDRVAILGSTSAQWTLADFGSLCAGAVVAPIYHTNSPEECAYVLAHSGARLVFCEDEGQAAKIASVREDCPALEHVVVFEGGAPDTMTLAQLCEGGEDATGKSVRLRVAATEPDHPATLVYTSGTTGPPKACMLTHGNILATTRMYIEQLGINETHTMYQFLPLAHVLARVAQAVVIGAGARAAFWTGDPAMIVDELSEFGPTHFPAVPRIYEKIHGAVSGQVQDGSRAKRRLFEWALERGRRARALSRERGRAGALTRLQYAVADRLVLSKIRRVYGPNLQLAMVGAAPVARELLEFFDVCGVLVLEGYGLSESCAAATLNTPGAVRFGSVGRPLPGTEVMIAGDGEILIRGPHVFRGYYHDAEATAAAFDPDGWLRSGDLGSIDGDGFLAITGRKKDLIITSSGKNVTPVNIESQLRDRRYVSEAVVFGDNRPYLVAMLTLDLDEAAKLAASLGIDPDPAAIARDPAVHDAIQKEVDAVNAKFARIEQIKRFAILDRELSQSGGELTPTLKVKRAFVYEKYADVFGGLYADRSGS